VKKKVSDLSADEYKKAFPIYVQAYNEAYKDWYSTEKENIFSVINTKDVLRINHIGSSAVKGILSKPMIDILLEIDGSCHVTKMLNDLKTIGFGEEILTRNEDPLRIVLGKGFSVDGYAERVYLLHLRYLGDWDELYFRDYLIANPDIADAYSQLKLKILRDIEEGKIERLPNGAPSGYSGAKLAFVKKYSEIAKQEFHNRYRVWIS